MMVEWHHYAAGPYKKIRRPNPRYWSGNGSETQRMTLKVDLDNAKQFTQDTGLLSYFGAWMPRDNTGGDLDETEVINFARFFVNELKIEQIPWSLNVLDDYYDTRRSQWITDTRNLKGAQLNMSAVLDNIVDVMM